MVVHAIQDRPAAMACQKASTRAPTHLTRYSVIPGYLAISGLRLTCRLDNSIAVAHPFPDECDQRQDRNQEPL